MSQPDYELVANLGDASPLEHGGYFVYRDRTGVYPPCAEWVEPPDYSNPDARESRFRWTVYRFDLEPCTLVNGVLSDNRFHPDHPAWFADSLATFADSFGVDVEEFAAKFTSDDPLDRAFAWREVGEYHGFENLDEYPLTLTRAEVNERYPEHAID